MALTYSITGGADAAKFNINATTGVLTFKTAPDFEKPGDADTNNVYQVEVAVSDGTATTKQMCSITVTNVADENLPPQFTSPAAYSVAENQTAVMTVTATDPDSGGGPPPTTGWPNAGNTGVPAGTNLTVKGDTQTTQDGQVINAFDVQGFLCIIHDNVEVKNSKFKVLRIGEDIGNNPTAKGVNANIHDCELTGTLWNTGIRALRGGFKFLRCNLHHVENGIWVEGSDGLVQDCWFHDLGWPQGEPHTDGLQIAPFQVDVRRMMIKHNNFDLAIAGVSSCVTISQGGAPGMNDSEIRNNRFAGGGYQIYFNGNSGPNIVDGNTFEQWVYGPLNPGDAYRDQHYTNNTFNGVLYEDGFPGAKEIDDNKARAADKKKK